MLNTFERLSKLPHSVLKDIDKARVLFSPNGIQAQTKNPQGGSEFKPVRTAWHEAGVPTQTVDAILTPDNKHYSDEVVINPEKIWHILHECSAEVVIAELTKLFSLKYSPVQPFLDHNGFNAKHGFNSHTLENHILPMAKRAVELTRGETTLTRNLLLLAIFLHDESNSLSRLWHALALRYSIPELFKSENVLACPVMAPAFIAAITHDEKSGGMPIIEDIVRRTNGNSVGETARLTTDMIRLLNQELSQKLDRVQSWLILIDKCHLGRERIFNGRDITPEALAADKHLLANVAMEMMRMGVSETNPRNFEVEYAFSFTVQDQLPPNIQTHIPRTTLPGSKLAVPEEMKNRYKEDSSSYFEQISALAIDLYEDRWLLSALQVFNLFGDEVDSFSIVFKNVDPDTEMKTEIVKTFTRESTWEKLVQKNSEKSH